MMSQALRGAAARAPDPTPSFDQGTRFGAAAAAQSAPLKGAWSPHTPAILAFMRLNGLSVKHCGRPAAVCRHDGTAHQGLGRRPYRVGFGRGLDQRAAVSDRGVAPARNPRGVQCKHGFSPLGAPDGAMKSAIFGDNLARLFHLRCEQRASLASDAVSLACADHDLHSAGRRNMGDGHMWATA